MSKRIVCQAISGKTAFKATVEQHQRVVVFVPNDRIATLVEVLCITSDANCASVRWLSGIAAIRMFDACRHDITVLVIRPEMILHNEPVRADAVMWVGDIPAEGTHEHTVYEAACRTVLPIRQRAPVTSVTLVKQYQYIV